MSYQPPFHVSADAVNLIAAIVAFLEQSSFRPEGADALKLRRANRVRTIQASLAIEGNTMSEEQVSSVLDGKRVIAPLRQIQEVKNNEVGLKNVYMGIALTYGDSIEIINPVQTSDGFEFALTTKMSNMISMADTLAGLGKDDKISLTLYLSDGLKKLGIAKTVMLTGDSTVIAESVAAEVGVTEYYGELLPDQKVLELERLDGEKSAGKKLAFVGDGINDAPVLARADVGIAMGALGSDAAIEAADVVLMTDEPSVVN